MRPKGNIYISKRGNSHGEVNIVLSLLEKLGYVLMQGLGAGLVAFAVIFSIFTFGPALREEFEYRFGDKNGYHVSSGFGRLLNFAEAQNTQEVQQEARNLGVDSEFSVVIPKIDAASNVIANVNPADEEDYQEALKKGVAHARGTYFPGQGENIYLFAHSTSDAFYVSEYNAVFYLLRKLEQGDTVVVFFADKKYEYRVTEKFVADADDTSWLTDSNGEERLILQTCDPPGTTWNRLIVMAEPV